MLKHIPFYASLLGRQLTEKIKSTNAHVLVYGAIEVHAMGEKGCIASNATIASETGMTEGTVATVISTLAKAGWVQVNLTKNNQRINILASMVIEPPSTPIEAGLQPPLNIDTVDTVIEKNIKKENLNNSDDSITGRAESAKLTPRSAAPPEEAFRNLNVILRESDRIKYLDARKKMFATRLKTFTEDEIAQAAMNLSKSPWHMGTDPNNTKKYASFDFLMRSDQQVDKWLNASSQVKRFA